MKFLVSFLLSCFVIAPTARTSSHHKRWGKTGHRVVGQVASFYINKKAEKTVSRILDGQSMAIASTWMDKIRSDPKWDYTHPWHYVTIPDNKTYPETEKNPKGDAIEAIRRMIKELKKDGLPHKKKQQDLKMLIHLVGDIHQPLHVGNGTDRGGNDVDVRWFGKPSNLHRVWDSGMIDQSQLSYTELAKAVNHITKKQVKEWQKSSVIDWARESKALRDTVYDIPKNHDMGYKYQYNHWPIVERRLLQAGIRLAGVLNNIYG